MQDILSQMTRIRGVGGCLLVSSDGLPMASALRGGTDEGQFAAGLGALVDTAMRLCSTFGLGRWSYVNGAGDGGGLLLIATGPAYLAVAVDPTANLALLQLEIKPFAERLAKALTL